MPPAEALGRNVKKIKGVADIVIAVDVTGSMGGCIQNLKQRIGQFVAGLQNPVAIEGQRAEIAVTDWRIRLLPYRDLVADTPDKAMLEDFDFVSTVEAAQAQLADARVVADGGGDEPESTLDAIYRAAARSKWRDTHAAHRFVIVFTDATTRDALHESTVGPGMPNDVVAVVNAVNSASVKLVMYALTCEAYERLKKAQEIKPAAAAAAQCWTLFATYGEAAAAFTSGSLAFERLMAELGKTIAISSAEVK